MEINTVKITKIRRFYNFLEKNNFLVYLLYIMWSLMTISFVFLFLFFKILLNIIALILSFIFISTFSFSVISMIILLPFMLYIEMIEDLNGLWKSINLPISHQDIEKKNINSLKEYLSFVVKSMKNKYPCKKIIDLLVDKEDFYYCTLFLDNNFIQFLNELSKEEYGKELKLIRTSVINHKEYQHLCLCKIDQNPCLIISNYDCEYKNINYNINFEYNVNTDDIIFVSYK